MTSLENAHCQEQKYVNIGRWGEWRSCGNPAKYDVVAESSGKGFTRGDTIHVCGVHRRKHEQQVVKAQENRKKREENQARYDAAKDRANRLGAGWPAYNETSGGYTGGLILTADEVDALLAELGR